MYALNQNKCSLQEMRCLFALYIYVPYTNWNQAQKNNNFKKENKKKKLPKNGFGDEDCRRASWKSSSSWNAGDLRGIRRLVSCVCFVPFTASSHVLHYRSGLLFLLRCECSKERGSQAAIKGIVSSLALPPVDGTVSCRRSATRVSCS